MLFGQVQAFIEVARTGNVSRAAEALYVTQPALTARIQALEKEFGETLFHIGEHIVALRCDRDAEFEVISGYRSPVTNAMLVRTTEGVAQGRVRVLTERA